MGGILFYVLLIAVVISRSRGLKAGRRRTLRDVPQLSLRLDSYDSMDRAGKFDHWM